MLQKLQSKPATSLRRSHSNLSRLEIVRTSLHYLGQQLLIVIKPNRQVYFPAESVVFFDARSWCDTAIEGIRHSARIIRRNSSIGPPPVCEYIYLNVLFVYQR